MHQKQNFKLPALVQSFEIKRSQGKRRSMISDQIQKTDAERASDADFGMRSQASFTSDKIAKVNDTGFELPNLGSSYRDNYGLKPGSNLSRPNKLRQLSTDDEKTLPDGGFRFKQIDVKIQRAMPDEQRNI